MTDKVEISIELLKHISEVLTSHNDASTDVKNLLENTHSDDYDEYYTFCDTLNKSKELKQFISAEVAKYS